MSRQWPLADENHVNNPYYQQQQAHGRNLEERKRLHPGSCDESADGHICGSPDQGAGPPQDGCEDNDDFVAEACEGFGWGQYPEHHENNEQRERDDIDGGHLDREQHKGYDQQSQNQSDLHRIPEYASKRTPIAIFPPRELRFRQEKRATPINTL